MSITQQDGSVAIQLQLLESGVNSLVIGNQVISVPVSLDDLSDVQILTGTFTPNNDAQTIAYFTLANAPTFILFVCDGPAVIFDATGSIDNVPVAKVFLWTIPPNSLSNAFPSQLGLNGSTGVTIPMAQGVPVNWTIICGKATIS